MNKKLPLKKRFYIQHFLKSVPSILGWKLFKIKPQTSTFLTKSLSMKTTNDQLKEAIESNEPFAAIRIGAVEMGALNNYEKISLGFRKTFKHSVIKSMKHNAGFFPCSQKDLTFYAKHFFKDASKTDFLGVSGIHMESYMAKRYMPNATPVLYEAFEPLHGDWIHALAGKRVLVISPFASDINKQFAIMDRLFPPGVIPPFTLVTYESVLTLGDEEDARYDTWFEALDAMKVDILKLDFDIALIGAGAYGSYLAWFIKSSLRKQAIQTGGATQTLFGILGKRWEQRHHVNIYINQYWIRPTRIPKGVEHVENGAYW
jgi:hypothetical protein